MIGDFSKARAVMRENLQADPGLMIGYVANVAMWLHDRFQGADFTDETVRNAAAYQILSLVFGFNPFRAGDKVKHAPSGETWVLACDQVGDEVHPTGWPESIAQAKDCTLVVAATDEERLDKLKSVADQCAGQMRGSRAKRQLEEAAESSDKDSDYCRGFRDGQQDAAKVLREDR